MKLMEFTKEEKENKICYIAKNVNMNGKNVNIVGEFYRYLSIKISIHDSLTNEFIETLSVNTNRQFLSNLKFESQIVINPQIKDKLQSDFKEVLDELTSMPLIPVNFTDEETFILTLKIKHFERMVHFAEMLEKC